MNLYSRLSRRESQIMDAVFQLGEASAADIQERMPDPPGNSSVRVMLRILEEKGFLIHREEGGRYLYSPAMESDQVERSALAHLVQTFFGGSVKRIVSALLSTRDLTQEELDELAQLIEQARKDE